MVAIKQKDLLMKCDCCKLEDSFCLLVLKKEKFSEGSRIYERVCLSCARELARKGIYNLGKYWHLYLNPLTRGGHEID